MHVFTLKKKNGFQHQLLAQYPHTYIASHHFHAVLMKFQLPIAFQFQVCRGQGELMGIVLRGIGKMNSHGLFSGFESLKLKGTDLK